MEYQRIFIENLKYYREQKNVSQAKLAELCDVQPGTIGCIEIGRQFPSFELLFKISDALSIHPADLFLRDASKFPEKDTFPDCYSAAQKLNALPEIPKKAILNMISEMTL